MAELRCPGTMHGIISDDGTTIEFKCKRRLCGAAPGVIILHTFELMTGRLVNTKRFAEPRERN